MAKMVCMKLVTNIFSWSTSPKRRTMWIGRLLRSHIQLNILHHIKEDVQSEASDALPIPPAMSIVKEVYPMLCIPHACSVSHGKLGEEVEFLINEEIDKEGIKLRPTVEL
jgi:hypothetical protein